MSDMIEATGLWINKKQNGETYMSGTLGGCKVLIFKNGFKEKESHPDYKLYFAEKKRDGNKPQDNSDFRTNTPAQPAEDGEIPF